MEVVRKYVLYTDGSTKTNPGKGGWASLVENEKGERRAFAGSEEATTSNRVEMLAVIKTLEQFPPSSFEVYTDSEYVAKNFTRRLGGWISSGFKTTSGAEVKNQDLWRRLHELKTKHNIRITWIRGHAGNTENEFCDTLAKLAADRSLAEVKEFGDYKLYWID